MKSSLSRKGNHRIKEPAYSATDRQADVIKCPTAGHCIFIPLRDLLALGPDTHRHPEADRQALQSLHQLGLVHDVHLREVEF